MRRFLGKVFCVVIGIPKHQLAVIEQEFYVSGQFFLKGASQIPTPVSYRHNHLKIISAFWGAANFKMRFQGFCCWFCYVLSMQW